MYSESDFEKFSQKIISSAYEKAEILSESAKKRAEKILDEAKSEALLVGTESAEALQKELKAYEQEHRARIESEAAREWSSYLGSVKSEISMQIQKRLEERFEGYARPFLEWIQESYDGGELRIYEGLDRRGIEGFKIVTVPEKMVVFSRGNLVIELTPASLTEEYSSLIEQKTAKLIGE